MQFYDHTCLCLLYFSIDYIRLSDNSNEGTVEVFFEGAWVKICEESWDILVANVVCKQLGYPRATTSSYIGEGNGVACLSGIRCNGYEKQLRQCQEYNWKDTIPSKNYAVVSCQLQGMYIYSYCIIQVYIVYLKTEGLNLQLFISSI